VFCVVFVVVIVSLFTSPPTSITNMNPIQKKTHTQKINKSDDDLNSVFDTDNHTTCSSGKLKS